MYQIKATRRVCNILRPIAINYMIILIGGIIAMSAYSVQKSAGDFLELLGTCNGDVIVLLCGIFWGEETEKLEEMKRSVKSNKK